ncbi:hypothetical protein J6590_016185 [Homalodisca vitripennis]|nr:hypothetical protein J6590_016185 [Homalodisca vitripennis]
MRCHLLGVPIGGGEGRQQTQFNLIKSLQNSVPSIQQVYRLIGLKHNLIQSKSSQSKTLFLLQTEYTDCSITGIRIAPSTTEPQFNLSQITPEQCSVSPDRYTDCSVYNRTSVQSESNHSRTVFRLSRQFNLSQITPEHSVSPVRYTDCSVYNRTSVQSESNHSRTVFRLSRQFNLSQITPEQCSVSPVRYTDCSVYNRTSVQSESNHSRTVFRLSRQNSVPSLQSGIQIAPSTTEPQFTLSQITPEQCSVSPDRYTDCSVYNRTSVQSESSHSRTLFRVSSQNSVLSLQTGIRIGPSTTEPQFNVSQITQEQCSVSPDRVTDWSVYNRPQFNLGQITPEQCSVSPDRYTDCPSTTEPQFNLSQVTPEHCSVSSDRVTDCSGKI